MIWCGLPFFVMFMYEEEEGVLITRNISSFPGDYLAADKLNEYIKKIKGIPFYHLLFNRDTQLFPTNNFSSS